MFPWVPSPADQRTPPPTYPEHTNSPLFDGHSAQMPQSPRPSQSLPATDGKLKPWLGPKARLALSPLSLVLVSLIFVLTRLLLSASGIHDKIQDAKTNLLATCAGAEGAATIAASMPHYMADSINANTVKAVQASVEGAGRVLMLAITAIEETLTWLVDSYRSLFVCFIELIVRGTLSVLISAVQVISSAVHDAAQGIRSAIQASVQGANSVLSGAVAGINEVARLFGQHVDAPTIDVPSLDALDNVTLPSVIGDSLIQLNSSLPTLDDLRQRMDTLIRGPFEEMKVDINRTITSFQFDHQALPVPEMNTVRFCNQIDTRPLDDLGNDLQKLAYIGAGLLGLLMLVLVLFCVAKEWWSWRSLQRHIDATREAWIVIDGTDALAKEKAPDSSQNGLPSESDMPRNSLTNDRIMSLMQLSSHPLLAMVAFRLGKMIGISNPRSRTHLRWLLSWVSHPAAVAALAAGLVGLVTVELQIVAIRATQRVYEGKVGNSFDQIGDGILASVNSEMLAASHDFANKSNTAILKAQDALNDHLFAWVNTTTVTMNNTLNEFMDGIAETLNDTLGSTPLRQPLQTFIDCFLGRKVAGIERALTWIHDNAHVNFTLVDDDVLLLGGERQQQLVSPIKAAVIGDNSDGSDQDVGIIPRIVNGYIRQLEGERTMFYVLLLIYGLILLLGIIITFWAATEHKFERWKLSKTPWINAKVTPFRSLAPSMFHRSSIGSHRGSINSAQHRLSKQNISYPQAQFRSLAVPHHAPFPSVSCQNTAPVIETAEALAAPVQRSSWLSFLDAAGSAGRQSEAEEPEDSTERFQRLFGRPPPASQQPISPTDGTKSVYSTATGADLSRATSARSGVSKIGHMFLNGNVPIQGNETASIASSIDTNPSPLRHRFTPSLSGTVSERGTDERGSIIGSNREASGHQQDKGYDNFHAESAGHSDMQSSERHGTPGITRKGSILSRTKEALLNATSGWYSTSSSSESREDDKSAHIKASPNMAQESLPSVDSNPTKSTAPDHKRQLRFTATPTDQVEARKRAQVSAPAVPELPGLQARGDLADPGASSVAPIMIQPHRPLPQPPIVGTMRASTEESFANGAHLTPPNVNRFRPTVELPSVVMQRRANWTGEEAVRAIGRPPSPSPMKKTGQSVGAGQAIRKALTSRPSPGLHAGQRLATSHATAGQETHKQNKLLKRILSSRDAAQDPGESLDGLGRRISTDTRSRSSDSARTSYRAAQPPHGVAVRADQSPKLDGKRVVISRPLPHPLGNRIHPCQAQSQLQFQGQAAWPQQSGTAPPGAGRVSLKRSSTFGENTTHGAGMMHIARQQQQQVSTISFPSLRPSCDDEEQFAGDTSVSMPRMLVGQAL